MSYSIALPDSDIYAVGNPTNTKELIDDIVTENILEVKTLIDEVWKSWQK